MSTVAEILQRKGPVFNYIDVNTLVIHALSSMKARNLSYLVVQKNSEYVGLVSERDYAHKIILMNKTSDTTTVGEIMSTNLPVVDISTPISDCMVMMNNLQSRYLPVFDKSQFVGVITIHDLLRQAIRQSQEVELVESESVIY